LPQQAQHLGRQHDVPVLASLGLHHADDVLGAVDVAGFEPDNLARTKPAALPKREHKLSLEAQQAAYANGIEREFADPADPRTRTRLTEQLLALPGLSGGGVCPGRSYTSGRKS